MWYMNEERELLVKAFREFAQQEVRPLVDKMEKDEEYPREAFRKMGELGFLGLNIDEQYGGAGADYINWGLMIEEMSKESHTFGLLASLNTDITIGTTHTVCTPEQIEKFIKPAINGDIILSLLFTEPNGLFNAPEYETVSVADGDDYIINGTKVLATNCDIADVHFVMCHTGEFDPVTLTGMSLFAIPADTDGFSVGHMEHKLGWKGSHTGQVYFNNCRVPKENLIGEFNNAWGPIGLGLFGQTLIGYAPLNLGAMEACFEKTKHFLQNRIQCGQSLWDAHEVIRNEMIKLWIKIENYRNATYAALEEKNRGENIYSKAVALKVEGEKILSEVASECIEFHGGTGTVYETGIESIYRNAKMGAIGCGANKILINSLSTMI